jgi:hypothetical protein
VYDTRLFAGIPEIYNRKPFSGGFALVKPSTVPESLPPALNQLRMSCLWCEHHATFS